MGQSSRRKVNGDPHRASDDIPCQGSEVAYHLQHLKAAVWKTIKKREKLPQPLFWSLFHVEVRELKQRRQKERLLKKIFQGLEI